VNINKLIKANLLESKNGYIILIYEINTGICLYEGIDVLVNQDLFIRYFNKFCLTIKKGKVINISRSLEFKPIQSPRFISTTMSNPNIGVLDIETFINSQGFSQVYIQILLHLKVFL
jgi:hypothetical protein